MTDTFQDEEVVVEEIVDTKKDELQETFESWVAEGLSEDAIVEKLHEDHGFSYPSAVNKLRSLKKAAGMTKPAGHKAEEVRAFIKELNDEGKSRSEIIEAMVEKFGYTKNSAASTFSTQGKELGIVSEGSRGTQQPIETVVTFAREHANDKRADFCKAMAEELGYSESTAGAFFTYLNFAKEYARQELEAAGYSDAA